MNSFKNKKIKKSKKRKSKKDKKKRRRHSSSSESSSSSSSTESTSSSSSTSSDEKHKKRKKKHKKNHKRKRVKIEEKPKDKEVGEPSQSQVVDEAGDDFGIPINLMDHKRGAPETKEQYDKRQNVIRRVVDEETGRCRLIKGDGEILEEMVSRDRHMQINKNATKTDAQNFEKKSMKKALKRK